MLEVSRSSYYDWLSRPPSDRDWDDAHLLDEIRDVHAASRATYGAPRVHAELKLGRGLIRPGSDGGSGYWIPTSSWSVCWAA